MIELYRREAAGRVAVVVATDRSDGDMHPRRTDPVQLAARQRAMTERSWVMVDEVHGVEVHRCRSDEAARGVVEVADVIVSIDGGDTLAVWAADCAPIVMFDAVGSVVACHAGWKGLASGVVDVAVDETTGSTIAVLGPCIHPCCYEFGRDDLDVVAAGLGVERDQIIGRTRAGAIALDVPAAVAGALAGRGVSLAVVGPCTGCDDRWYSHRARSDTGRHAVIGWTEAL